MLLRMSTTERQGPATYRATHLSFTKSTQSKQTARWRITNNMLPMFTFLRCAYDNIIRYDLFHGHCANHLMYRPLASWDGRRMAGGCMRRLLLLIAAAVLSVWMYIL